MHHDHAVRTTQRQFWQQLGSGVLDFPEIGITGDNPEAWIPNTTKLLPEVGTRTRTKTVRWLNSATEKSRRLYEHAECLFLHQSNSSKARLAQSVARETLNLKVEGSSPSSGCDLFDKKLCRLDWWLLRCQIFLVR
jgi:uncharacterized protein (DUF2235 family)